MERYSVMVIDDNPEDRYLLKRHLKLTGLDVHIFESGDGEEAIKFLQSYGENRSKYPIDFPPMLLFLDINMPILDGWGFLASFENLRISVDIQSSVVVMFTSSDRPEDRARAEKFSFVTDYIVKGELETDQLKKILTSYRTVA